MLMVKIETSNEKKHTHTYKRNHKNADMLVLQLEVVRCGQPRPKVTNPSSKHHLAIFFVTPRCGCMARRCFTASKPKARSSLCSSEAKRMAKPSRFRAAYLNKRKIPTGDKYIFNVI